MIYYRQNREDVTETFPMGSFGENLRREREMRGVTLEEISAATKISVRFLKSIENEEFTKLPGGIFSRSFVRAYAHYLGLEEDPVIAEFQVAAKVRGETDLSRFSVSKPYSGREHRSRSTLIAVLAACVLLATGYGLWRHSRQAKETLAHAPRTQPLPTVTTSSPAAAPSAGPESSAAKTVSPPAATPSAAPAAQNIVNAGSSGPPNPSVAQPANVADDGSLVLQVATTERSWVAIDTDGKTVMQGVMNPNEIKTFKAKASIDFLTGNAQGVILTLNGRTLKPLGRQGEVKSVHLSWNDLKKQSSP